jgi:uncharacterized protein (DUF952 family)
MIWHLLPLSQWRRAESAARLSQPAGAEPFLHASPDPRTALAVANALFGQCAEPLVGLGLAESRLAGQVRYEPADPAPPPGVPAETLFPHVYGLVDTSAVAEVRYVRRDAAGRYVALEAAPADVTGLPADATSDT